MLSCDTAGSLRVNVTSATGVAQGSTTSGQSVSPIGCRTLTSAPTDTTAQTNMPWCRTNGAIAIDTASLNGTAIDTNSGNKSAGTQRVLVATDALAVPLWGHGATGSAAPANATYVGANSAGNLTGLIQADSSAAINVSTATTTQIVALSSSKKIYVTSLDVISGGTGNITFVYGTGANCGTGTTSLTGAYNLTAQVGIAKGSGLGPVLVVPASNALCVTTSAAVQMSGSVAYTQF